MTADTYEHNPRLSVTDAASTPINENLEIRVVASASHVVCVHCDHVICESSEDIDDHLAHYEGPPSDGGPMNWATPQDFVDVKVVFRQSYCPECFTAVMTRILPFDHPPLRDQVFTRSRRP